MNPPLKAGDVFLTCGTGPISWLIRKFTRGIGEKRTKVNHVGLIVKGGPVDEAIAVEALVRVKSHSLWSQYGPPSADLVAVYRPKNLTADEIDTIVRTAEKYVTEKFGREYEC